MIKLLSLVTLMLSFQLSAKEATNHQNEITSDTYFHTQVTMEDIELFEAQEDVNLDLEASRNPPSRCRIDRRGRRICRPLPPPRRNPPPRRPPPRREKKYYDWGRASNGWGYCYLYRRTNAGTIKAKVSDNFCEVRNPSYYDWGRGRDGWGYCYQWTPYHVAMNEGRPQNNQHCERYNPSYYDWSRDRQGEYRCYQFTAYGLIMNQGRPVSEGLCR